MNKRFLFFENFKSIADKLPDDMRLKFYDALLSYVFDGVEPDDVMIAALITAIKPSLDKEDKRGGNHNPTGQNQYSEVKIGQKEVKNNFEQVKIGQSGQSFLETETGKKKEETKENNTLTGITKEKNKIFQKLTFEDVVDWESLFDYWEQNKKGGKYKNAESRNRQLAKLKELTNGDFEYAKQAIVFCIDNKYQGFYNGSSLFYRNVAAATASRKTADDDAEYWEDLARRLKVQEGAAQ